VCLVRTCGASNILSLRQSHEWLLHKECGSSHGNGDSGDSIVNGCYYHFTCVYEVKPAGICSVFSCGYSYFERSIEFFDLYGFKLADKYCKRISIL
jgi:hypothetical protein